jgi:ketosteroid isomerase-like protein
MRPWAAVFAGAVLVVCLLMAARPIAAAPRTEDEITQLERYWLAAEANADMTTLRRLIADDFMGTAFGPGVLSKSDVVPAEGGSESRMPKSTLKDSTVRVFGDTAVLMGSVAVEGANAGSMRVTTVFQKRPLGWQMIATHMSRTGE